MSPKQERRATLRSEARGATHRMCGVCPQQGGSTSASPRAQERAEHAICGGRATLYNEAPKGRRTGRLRRRERCERERALRAFDGGAA